MLGPNKQGTFDPITVHGVQYKRVECNEVFAGQQASFAFKSSIDGKILSRKDYKQGATVIDPSLEPRPAMEFEAKFRVLATNATSITPNY